MASKRQLVNELPAIDRQLWEILDAYTNNLLSLHDMHKQVQAVLKTVKKENK